MRHSLNIIKKVALRLIIFLMIIIFSKSILIALETFSQQDQKSEKSLAARYLSQLPEAKYYLTDTTEKASFAGGQKDYLEKIMPAITKELGINWQLDSRLSFFCLWLNELFQASFMPDGVAIKEAANWLGLPEPTPHFLIMKEPLDLRLPKKIKAKLLNLPDLDLYTHYGALADGNPTGEITIIIAFSQRHVLISPVPRRLTEPGNLEFKLSFYPGYSDALIIHKLPDGKSEPIRIEGQLPVIYSTKINLKLSQPGIHELEIVAQNKKGPQVLANFPVFVGTPGSFLTGQAIDLIGTREQSASKVRERLYQLINEERKKAGLQELKIDSELEKIASSHCQDMLKNNFVGHVSPSTGGPDQRLKSVGIITDHFGENVAQGYNSAEEIHRGLMESPGHRMVILDSRLTSVGIGVETKGSGPRKAFLVTELFIGHRLPADEPIANPAQPEEQETSQYPKPKIIDRRQTPELSYPEINEKLKEIAQQAADKFSQQENFEPDEVQLFLISALLKEKISFERMNAMSLIAASQEEIIEKMSKVETAQDQVGLGIARITSGSKKGKLLGILVLLSVR
ncbi:MAG: CAP domain-containing protein [Candidatus Saccharicenans sp.]